MKVGSQFSWTRQWYPLAAVDDLDDTRPHAAQLLGMRLVLWRDAGGDWRCFEDLCPHRRVPGAPALPLLEALINL